MNGFNLASLGAAAIAWAMVAVNGSEVVLSRITPAPIEGTAVAPAEVRAGQVVPITWRIIKRTDCSGQNARVWHGDGGFFLSESYQPTALPVTSEAKVYKVQTMVPALVPHGKLTLQIVGYYQCPGAPKQEFMLGPIEMKVVQ